MANIKISELNELTQKESNDFLPIVDSSANETKKISVGNLTPSNDKLVHVGTSVDEDYRVNVLRSNNMFNKNTALLNTGINSSTGLPTTQSNVFLSDFIKVEPNTDYYISGGITSVYGYSSNFTFLSPIVDTSGAKTFNSGNAEYVRIKSWYASSSDDMQIQLNNSLMNIGTSAIPYEPYITPSINVDGEEIYRQGQNEVYSTSERIIGTWIDGKPLYRKVIDCGALPNNATKSINHNVTNVDYMVKVEGTAWNPTIKNAFPLNLTRPSSATGNIGLWYDETQVKIETGTDRSAWTKTYVILEYTKTTD